MRTPNHIFLLNFIVDFHLNIFILTTIRRYQAALHSRRIDKEFERWARLTHRAHFVVLPSIKIDITYPSSYIPRIWLHWDKTGMHKLYHKANRVHRTHFLFFFTIITKKLHLVRLIEVIVYRIRIIRIACSQLFISITTSRNIFNKTRYYLSLFITPRLS